MSTIQITLPDGSVRTVAQKSTVMDLAMDIGPGLAKATIGAEVDGVLVDTDFKLNQNSNINLITLNSDQGLEIIRHSTAHLLAQAVKRLYPEAQVTIGPVIENGFYYDFAYDPGFTDEDLDKIQAKMQEIVKENLQVTHQILSKSDAIQFFKSQGEDYKVEIIESIPDGEEIKLYSQGEFTDVCRGPHVPRTGLLKAFKLQKVSGAYWRGDSNNKMLQRIYGTAFSDKKLLKAYLNMLEEAQKRDHRKLGKQLDLFHFQEDAPGIPFWHGNGVNIWRVVEDYMRASNLKYGCEEIKTPLIADLSLWNKSGHSAKYLENMFTTSVENRDYALRPMNCPGGVQVYNAGFYSYKDLPIRAAEFGIVHRNEPSGALHGLMRARSFTQDDGHIYCLESQVKSEVCLMVDQAFEVYKDFGFNNFEVKIALRPEDKDSRIGDDADWDRAEKVLAEALDSKNIAFDYLPGEGAFYGPKIEFHLKDSIGRRWQCGTIQVDFSMPKRLGAVYIDSDGEKKTPVMLHRAIVGSLERFIGIVIEDCAGKLPVWLAPTQICIMTITDRADKYTQKIGALLKKSGFRVKLDLRNEKIGFKIRERTLDRIPYLLVVGDSEVEQSTVAVRTREGEDLGVMTIEQFKQIILDQIALKSQAKLIK